jgi:Zn-dependent protease with chaperone function
LGYLLHIALALLAQGLAEEGVGLEGERPLVLVAFMLVPHALGLAARSASLRGRFGLAARLLGVLQLAPAGLHAAALLACGWNQTLERWLGEGPKLLGWPQPSALLALAPLCVYVVLAIDARARALDSRPGEIARLRRFQLRMFLSALAPTAILVLLVGLAGRSAELRARVEYVQLDAALFASALLLLLLAGLPLVLRYTWDTEALPKGPLREFFEELARRARFRCQEILVWRTGHSVANAAVVGVAAPLRVVLLSDALLSQLVPRELQAVFAHEVGHTRRHHVWIFAAWTAAFFLGLDLAIARWLPVDEVWSMALLGTALLLWYVGFGWLSRRFELDADLFAVELTGDIEGMVGALESVGGPHARRRSSWRHFSTEQRVEFLRHLALAPERGSKLRRKLRATGWLGVVLAAAALLAQARSLASTYRTESARAQLALGRFDRAAGLLARQAEPSAELVRQAALGAELLAGRPQDELAVLESAAIASLERGDLERTLDLLTLSYLRGERRLVDLTALLSELEADPAGADWARAARTLEASAPRWAAALDRAAARDAAGPGPRPQ